LKIEQLGNNEAWQITTEDGTQHYFSSLPKVWQEGDGSARPVSRTFLLSDSKYPNGQNVHYEYERKDNVIFSRTEDGEHIVKQCVGLVADMACDIPPKITTWKTRSDEILLKSITTDNYIAEFKMSARSDLSGSLKLDTIVIRSLSASQWSGYKRKICFNYSYFESAVGGNTWLPMMQDTTDFFQSNHLNKRLKLDAVYEVDASGKRTNQLSFDYYNPTGLPPKNSFAMDYWGYYNGQTNNKYLIPYFSCLLWGQSSYAIQHQAGCGGNRACNPECLCNGMLRSVRYATGGMTIYSYEPNGYQSSQRVPTCDEMAQPDFTNAPLVLSLRNHNAPLENTYGYFNVNIGDEVKIKLILCNGLNAWSDMAGSGYALLFTPTGGSLRKYKAETFDVSNVSGFHSDRILQFTAEEAGSFQLILTFPSALGDQSEMNSKHGDLTGDVYVIPGLPVETYDYSRGGGVRVKTVNYFNTSSTSAPPVLSYTYEYPSTGGVLFTPLAFHKMYENLDYFQASYTDGHENGIFGTGGIEMTLSSENFHSAPYSTVGTSVCYPEVTVRKTHFGVSQGYTVHTFWLAHEISTEHSFQVPDVGNGKPLSTKYYAEDGTLLKSESYHYDVVLKHFYSGVTITDHFNRSPRFYAVGGCYLTRMIGGDIRDDYWGRFTSLIYGIRSQSCLPESKIVYQDGVSTTTTYEYDDHCQLKKENVTGSDGKVHSTNYSYPYDFNFASYTAMTNKNFLSYPVEVKQLVDGKLAGSKLTQYATFNGKYLPKSIARGKFAGLVNDAVTFSSSGASSSYYPATDITYLKYDANGNPVHINVKGEDIIYIWGYNYQYPVAEIRKSSYAAVQSALGATPESFSSAVTPPATITALRSKLPDAQVTTYTYTPLQGMKTMTAPNGKETSFEYDGFGRLTKTLDHDGKTVEEYDYHYKN
jgi:YD repeat-containing protein